MLNYDIVTLTALHAAVVASGHLTFHGISVWRDRRNIDISVENDVLTTTTGDRNVTCVDVANTGGGATYIESAGLIKKAEVRI